MSNPKELELFTNAYQITRIGIRQKRATTKNEWEKYGDALRAVDEAKQWAIGDWLVDGKSHYGDGVYEKAKKTLKLDSKRGLEDFKQIAEQFNLRERHVNLSFNHHRTIRSIKKLEVICEKCKYLEEDCKCDNPKLKMGRAEEDGKYPNKEIYDKEKQQELLDKAEKEDLTVKELRQVVRDYESKQTKEINLYNSPEKYQIIYADPPWKYWEGGLKSQSQHYDTMTIEKIKSLPVNKIASENSVLFLWVTYPILDKVFDVIKAWGFEYSTVAFTWVKSKKDRTGFAFGCGGWTRANAELCILGKKGSIERKNASISQIIHEPKQEHSKKPDIVREKIVKLVGNLKRIELFAREEHEGWDNWGDEV